MHGKNSQAPKGVGRFSVAGWLHGEEVALARASKFPQAATLEQRVFFVSCPAVVLRGLRGGLAPPPLKRVQPWLEACGAFDHVVTSSKLDPNSCRRGSDDWYDSYSYSEIVFMS